MDKAATSTSVAKASWPAPTVAALLVLRTVIGWHFLFEGLTKLAAPNWSSAEYLKNSQWLFADAFHQLANNPAALRAVDLLNVWGLTLIGAGLMLGLFTRTASVSGALLLVLYYVANPPFLAGVSGVRLEGSYLFLDKNAVECAALLLLASVPARHVPGLGGFVRLLVARKKKVVATTEPVHAPETDVARRELLGHLALLPVVGAFIYAFQKKRGWHSFELEHLVEWKREPQIDGMSGATMKSFNYTPMSKLEGTVPMARIGSMDMSRMVLGGNLIGGWAHSRDLAYVSDLVKAYHSDEKVFQTLNMAERSGINTIITNPRLCRVINDYWKKEGGSIQFISDCAEGTLLEGTKKSIDAGARSCYAQGGIMDRLVAEGKFDEIESFLKFMKDNRMIAGLGAHKLETVMACVDRGYRPDYWVKTIHHRGYWSANTATECDNIWCVNPEETIAYMAALKEPWIGFKILAAGAIHPKDGFAYALQNGADFICVGMYDFQMVDNVNHFVKLWGDVGGRERVRPWCA